MIRRFRASGDAPAQFLFWGLTIALSVALRLWSLDLLAGRAPDGDTPNYLAIADNILSGRGLLLVDSTNLHMRATYPPLYPMLLAAVGLAVPLTFTAIAAMNTVIELACAWLMTRLGRDLGAGRAGSLAAALYIVWPTNVGMAPLARKEPLIALLVVALLVVLVRAIDRGSWRSGIAYGVLAGLLALTQPGLLFLPALFALAALPRFADRRRWLAMMSLAAACAVLTLLPWWIRNWLLFHRFVPLTAAGGYSLWIGSTPVGDGTYLQAPPQFWLGDEFRMSAALGAEAKRIIASDPLGYVAHCVGKFLRAMFTEDRGVSQIYWAVPRGHARIAGIWVGTATLLNGLTVVVALAAAWVQRRQLLSQFLLAGIANILLFGIWFEFDQRHRYFLTPLLLLSAVNGLLVYRRSRSAGPAGTASGAGGLGAR
jgi:4-amino-4-deoxy-L-arabinose transferase-like glycosyltransferase